MSGVVSASLTLRAPARTLSRRGGRDRHLHGPTPRGEPCLINGDGLQTRDYVYVGDVAEAALRALERPEVTGPINIGTGVETDGRRALRGAPRGVRPDGESRPRPRASRGAATEPAGRLTRARGPRLDAARGTRRGLAPDGRRGARRQLGRPRAARSVEPPPTHRLGGPQRNGQGHSSRHLRDRVVRGQATLGLPRVLPEAERVLAHQDAVDVVHAFDDLQELRVGGGSGATVYSSEAPYAPGSGRRPTRGAEGHLRRVQLGDRRLRRARRTPCAFSHAESIGQGPAPTRFQHDVGDLRLHTESAGDRLSWTIRWRA